MKETIPKDEAIKILRDMIDTERLERFRRKRGSEKGRRNYVLVNPQKMSFYIDESIANRLKEYAAREKIPMSQAVNYALYSFLDEKGA